MDTDLQSAMGAKSHAYLTGKSQSNAEQWDYSWTRMALNSNSRERETRKIFEKIDIKDNYPGMGSQKFSMF